MPSDTGPEDQLIHRFQPRLRAFFSVRTGGRPVVEDLTQEAMMAVICAVREGQIREPDHLSSFVYGVARNLLNDYFRKQAKSKLEPLSEDHNLQAAPPSHHESERFQMAQHEIDRMDSVDRNILTLALVEGLKPGEIATALRLSGEVVRQRKSRALRKIADRLNPKSRNTDRQPLSS